MMKSIFEVTYGGQWGADSPLDAKDMRHAITSAFPYLSCNGEEVFVAELRAPEERRWPAYAGLGDTKLVFNRGLHRHYKGGYYTAIDLVFHHESRQPLVLYVSHEHGTVSARPFLGHEGDPDGWSDLVEVDGEMVRRFTLVETDGEPSDIRFSAAPKT